MDVGLVVAFWTLSFALVLTPGADWAYAISAGLHGRGIAPAVAGLLGGYVTHTVLVAAGVGALVSRAPAVLTVLTLAGSVYLLWLGVATAVRPARLDAVAGVDAPASGPRRWAARGWGISGLNPKALLLFLALLPQFTRPGAPWPVAAQIVVLGMIHTVSCAAVYTGVALTARRVLRTRPAAARTVSVVSGIAMIVVGLVLGAEPFVR